MCNNNNNINNNNNNEMIINNEIMKLIMKWNINVWKWKW